MSMTLTMLAVLVPSSPVAHGSSNQAGNSTPPRTNSIDLTVPSLQPNLAASLWPNTTFGVRFGCEIYLFFVS